MNKTTLLVTLCFTLFGCTTIDSELATKEKLLIGSSNSQQLVEFYKANLKNDPSYKAKLVNLYLDQKDTKSAELYRNTYSQAELGEPAYIFTNARLNYQNKSYEQALSDLELYLDEGGEENQYYLLKGKIYAQQKQFQLAIEQFEESRKEGASDREAGNNIAVVHMMQGDYLSATDILYDLYIASPSDPKVRSNLIVSSVHSERPDIALEVLKQSNSDEQARAQLAALLDSLGKTKGKAKHVNQQQNPISAKNRSNTSFVAPTQTVSHLVGSEERLRGKNSSDGSTLDPKKLKPGAEPIYRVQVLATYTVIPSDYLNYLKSNYGPVYSYTHGLWKRYCIGDFDNVTDAQAFLDSLDIKGAFVVDYTKKRYVQL